MGLSLLRVSAAPEAVLSWQGWSQHQDDRITTLAAPLLLADGVRTKYVNNAGLVAVTRPPAEATAPLWDTSTNKVQPIAAFDTYNIRLGLTAEGYSGGSGYLTIELDIGGTIGTIYTQTTRLLRAGSAQAINMSFPVFAGSTFLANGGEFYVTYSGSGICNVHTTSIMIQRTSKQWS